MIYLKLTIKKTRHKEYKMYWNRVVEGIILTYSFEKN